MDVGERGERKCKSGLSKFGHSLGKFKVKVKRKEKREQKGDKSSKSESKLRDIFETRLRDKTPMVGVEAPLTLKMEEGHRAQERLNGLETNPIWYGSD